MMPFAGLCLLMVILSVTNAMPYRSFAPRSVPGRVKSSSSPDSLHDYFENYFSAVRQRQQPQYGMTEYEPPYPQYLSNYPQIDQETLNAIIPYMSKSGSKDYSYDYNTSPASSYNEENPSWYEDWSDSQDYATLPSDRTNQDAALLQLFLDHLTGKYSLEDLKTLEREAAIEDNNENQLQALMSQKNMPTAFAPAKPVVERRPMSFRQGQKEEAFLVPSSTLRKPVFTRSAPKPNKKPKVSTTPKTVAESTEGKTTESSTSTVSPPSSTMEPFVRSAYESLLSYLDRERIRRQKNDESEHVQQKRFISDTQSLTQQLVSLKKSLT